MELDARRAHKVLTEKGVKALYHANTVTTACHFLKANTLLSRGDVERFGLYQTPQSSDELDVRHGLWFDVFVDSVDIHDRARQCNVYGPVLFKIDVDVLLDTHNTKLWVTKLNPTKWGRLAHKHRWFMSIQELEEEFAVGEFDQMIVFRNIGGRLPLGSHLKTITLDDPAVVFKGNIDCYSLAFGALSLAGSQSNAATKIVKRACRPNCRCVQQYKRSLADLKMRFLPRRATPPEKS